MFHVFLHIMYSLRSFTAKFNYIDPMIRENEI